MATFVNKNLEQMEPKLGIGYLSRVKYLWLSLQFCLSIINLSVTMLVYSSLDEEVTIVNLLEYYQF